MSLNYGGLWNCMSMNTHLFEIEASCLKIGRFTLKAVNMGIWLGLK